MSEMWKRWKDDLNLPQKLVLESLTDNMEGISLKFSDENDENTEIEITFTEHALSYRNRDEGEFLRKFKYLGDEYGDEFYTKWSLFEVDSSHYVQWFNEESLGIHQDENIRHFVFITMNDVVEVLSTYEPEIKY